MEIEFQTDSFEILSKQLIEYGSGIEIVQPYLLVTGKAGIGKSHLLADYAKKFTGRGHSTFYS